MPAEHLPLEIGNDQLVGVQGGKIVIMAPKRVMTPDEALRHAAWLVALRKPVRPHGWRGG